MSEPQQGPADGAAEGGWSWGPLEGGAPGYGGATAQQPPTPQAGPPQYGQPKYGAPQYGQPQYGAPQYGQPQYGAPQYGQPQYGAPGPGPAGYVPLPVQRGIVPLRPLSLGEIYDGGFRAIRANPRVMFGMSAVVVTLSVLVSSVVQWYSFGWVGDWASTAVPEAPDVTAGDAVGAVVGTLASVLLTFVATTILTGLLIVSVSRSVIGQQVGIGEAWREARPQIWRLLGLTLLITLIISAPLVVYVVVLIALAGAGADGAAVALGILGFFGLLVYFAWVYARTALTTPALVLEKQGVIAGLKRGWTLTRGSFWRVFGIMLLTNIIVGVVASIVTVPASLITTITGMNPLGAGSLAVNGIATVVGTVVTTPFTAAVVALLYIDLRMRREGLDVVLARAAEDAAEGRTP